MISVLKRACLAAAVVLIITVAPAVASRGTDIREVPCEFDLAQAVKNRVACFRLTVPRRYDAPQRGTYELAVTVRRPPNPVPGQDPVLWLHGGPGAGTNPATINTDDPFMPGSTVVYLASRGAYPSQPQPCRDLDSRKLLAFTGRRTWEERVALFSAPFIECRKRLDEQGIRTDEFGTRLVTEDIERLRKALGVKRWNIWSVSYGTGTAYDLMSRYPSTVRAAYLDSAIAPYDVPGVNTRSYVAALERLADYCRIDAQCRSELGDLFDATMRARAQVARTPMVVRPFESPLAGEDFHLDREHFDLIIASLMDSSRNFVQIPRLIQAIEKENLAVVSEVVRPVLAGLSTMNVFGRPAFHCVERPQYHLDQSIYPGGRIVQMIDVCPKWSSAGSEIRVPRDTRIPVLLLTGEMDAGTPPAHAVTAQAIMGGSAQVVIAPKQSHLAYARSACIRAITHAFFANPKSRVDDECLAREPAIPFAYLVTDSEADGATPRGN